MTFETFCSCTSLHGWKYLSSEVNRTLRVGWVLVVLASMGVASFFLGYSFNDFISSTVQTTQDTSRSVQGKKKVVPSSDSDLVCFLIFFGGHPPPPPLFPVKFEFTKLPIRQLKKAQVEHEKKGGGEGEVE